MAESVYKIIELVGTSTESWEKAATAAVTRRVQDAARPAHRRGEPARSADRGRQGARLPRQGEGQLQVRGQGLIAPASRSRGQCCAAAVPSMARTPSRPPIRIRPARSARSATCWRSAGSPRSRHPHRRPRRPLLPSRRPRGPAPGHPTCPAAARSSYGASARGTAARPPRWSPASRCRRSGSRAGRARGCDAASAAAPASPASR